MTAIVQTQTPEAREYARYLVEIEERKRRIADRRAELESLKLALSRFEAEYHARVGVLFVELDRLRLSIREYELRIKRLKADPSIDPAELEREIAAEFTREREEVRAEEEETRRYERAFEREQARPHLDPSDEERAKRLFRDLAKRFHPDLARTEEECRQRAEIMQRVNAAYAERNVAALEALAAENEINDASFEAKSIGEKLVWAIREIARLEAVSERQRLELIAIKASDLYVLQMRHQGGETVLERLEGDLRSEIKLARGHLRVLIDADRELTRSLI